ncbi:MAG: RNA-binding S4 domain-containing protein [Bacteroidales bacterium]|nr:RNA-binding S4 domain-containing protein [Bacteroidales bacterium]MCF8458009.1 RNA-binding S4 domain-containing protein [Bacteroidales bacterium]
MEVRIDKYIWAVRIFKTRSQATDACKKGRVSVNGIEAKPSRGIKPGDEIRIKRPPVVHTYKVLQPLANRVSAKLVPDYILDITPEEELHKLEQNKFGGFFYRDKGTGRPTKKERRIIDNLNSEVEDED